MFIDIEKIIQSWGRPRYREGVRLFQDGRVDLRRIEENAFEAAVHDRDQFEVSVRQAGGRLTTRCSCRERATCGHIIAAMLAARRHYTLSRSRTQSAGEQTHWRDFFHDVYTDPDSPPASDPERWKVVFVLNLEGESWSIAPQKAYIKKNGELGRLTSVGEFDPENHNLKSAPNDPMIFAYLQRIGQSRRSFYNMNYFGSRGYLDWDQYHFKYGYNIGPLFDFLRDSALCFQNAKGKLDPIVFHPQACRIDLDFKEGEEAYRLQPRVILDGSEERLTPQYRILTENPIWLLKSNQLLRVENIRHSAVLVPFTRERMTLNIPRREFSQFLEEVFPRLTPTTPLTLPESVRIVTLRRFDRACLTLSENEDHLQAGLSFLYDNFQVSADDPRRFLFRQDGEQVFKIERDFEAEKRADSMLKLSGLKASPRGGYRIIHSKALNWLFSRLPELSESGFEIRGRDSLRRYRVRTGAPNVRIALKSQIDWFDLNVEIDFDGIELTLLELKRALSHHRRIVKLSDGSMARLPEDWYRRLSILLNVTDAGEKGIKVSRHHATLIDTLFKNRKADARFERSLKRLKTFSGIRARALPPSLRAILRPYQKSGYDWLHFLREYAFGGCLADDMGLGKTVQTLSLLLREKQRGNRYPSLIVCPTSVVFNWEKEIAKFTSPLRTLTHTGLQRDIDAASFKGYDIVLTTYGVMRRDIAFLKDVDFFYVILDESQKIKNPTSQTAKASRLLRARHRLALTGTPVENNTVELWSLFAFLNPGLLGSLNFFRKTFTIPIEKKGDEETIQLLRQLIYPFVLRRTKGSVAPELPAKIENTYFPLMSPPQRRLYRHWRNYYRALILKKIDREGLHRARMNVLEGLVKLRQIACHPWLVDTEAKGESGKFDLLVELVDEILAENHKILLFSQFVRMLSVIREHLDREKVVYEYLDGATTDRARCVDRFQNDDDVRLFLISLRAGGTGLNLTAADYVIHYDPWWNPAVEVQATDRAHRIGQNKKVFVYRLISKGTVEEKILELQEKKRRLVSQVISTDIDYFKSLTRDDIDALFS